MLTEETLPRSVSSETTNERIHFKKCIVGWEDYHFLGLLINLAHFEVTDFHKNTVVPLREESLQA